MQKDRGHSPVLETISKPVLLGFITIVVTGVASPFLFSHVTHPSMIFHILLHMAGLTVAIFLSTVSLLAYSRNTTTRMLLMAAGFVTLAAVELLYLFQAGGIYVGQFTIPIANIELSHMVLLMMVSLFGLGVLKVNK
jgi:hypothetical protein